MKYQVGKSDMGLYRRLYIVLARVVKLALKSHHFNCEDCILSGPVLLLNRERYTSPCIHFQPHEIFSELYPYKAMDHFFFCPGRSPLEDFHVTGKSTMSSIGIPALVRGLEKIISLMAGSLKQPPINYQHRARRPSFCRVPLCNLERCWWSLA